MGDFETIEGYTMNEWDKNRRGPPSRRDGQGSPPSRGQGSSQRGQTQSRGRGTEDRARREHVPVSARTKTSTARDFHIMIACAIGVERALGNELKHLNFKILDSGPGRYEIDASLEDIYKALRCLRTAERVMVVLSEGRARNFDELFALVEAIGWERWLPVDARIHIDKVRLHDSPLRSVPDIQAISQKAVFDRLGKIYKVRKLPENGSEFKVRIYVERENVRVCLDLSGEPLHKRGWRSESGVAPLKETIAAAMIILSGWKRRHPFHDPFCGSGTLAIEALSFAFDLPPNLDRAMGIANTKIHDPKTDHALQRGIVENLKLDHLVRISGSDSDKYMIELAKQGFQRMVDGLGLSPEHSGKLLSRVDFFQSPMQSIDAGKLDTDGFFLCNPPYGERIGDIEHARQTYAHMRHLRREFPSWRLMTVTSWDKFADDIEERPTWTKPIRNGVSEAFLYFYEAPEPVKKETFPAG